MLARPGKRWAIAPVPISPPSMCVLQLRATANPHRVFMKLEKGTPSSGNDLAPWQGT